MAAPAIEEAEGRGEGGRGTGDEKRVDTTPSKFRSLRRYVLAVGWGTNPMGQMDTARGQGGDGFGKAKRKEGVL